MPDQMSFNLNGPPDLTLHPLNEVVLVPNTNSSLIPGIKDEFTVSQQDTLRLNAGQPPNILAAAVAAVEGNPSMNSSVPAATTTASTTNDPTAGAGVSSTSNSNSGINNNNNNTSGNSIGDGSHILSNSTGSESRNDNRNNGISVNNINNNNNNSGNTTSVNTNANNRGSIPRDPEVSTNTPSVAPSRPTSNEFVRKLFKILESNAYPDIIRWSRDGESFIVLDTGSFTTQILPNHFKHSNFASFVRQLNKYDFHKIKRKPNRGPVGVNRELSWEFKHPYFRIHDEASLDLIKRKLTSSRRQQESTDSSDANLPSPHANIGGLVKEEALKYCVSKESFSSMKRRVEKLERELEMSKNEAYQSKAEINKLASKYNTLLKSLITFKTTSENLVGNLNTLCTSLVNNGIKLPPTLLNNDVFSLPPMEKFNTMDAILVNDVNMMKDRSNSDPTSNLNGAINEPTSAESRLALGRAGSNNAEVGSNTNTNVAPFDPNPAPSNTLPQDPGIKLHDNGTTAGVPQGPNVDLNSANNLVAPLVQPLNLLPDPTTNPQAAISTKGDNTMDLNIAQTSIDALNSAPSQQSSGIVEQPQESAALRKGFHVLLVEDDVISIQLCSKFLKRYGCTVQVVTDGLSAISTLKKFRYDLVLMDIVMPSIDGASATSIIRKFDSETPIIAMTGNIKNQDLIRYLQYGMNDILAKPFTRNDLHSMLLRYLKDKIPLCEQQQQQQQPQQQQ